MNSIIQSRLSILALLVLFNLISSTIAAAQDWPMWRYDAGRTGVSPHEMPAKLYPSWSLKLGERRPVWDDPLNRDLMPYDSQFEPVVVDDTLLLTFNDTDKVLALDVKTGAEKWRFYADGPIRFPAACAEGKAYVVSDDGYLYCLDVKTGKELWKFRGGPSDRKILGNQRIISTWPARGAAVVDDGTVYFTASIWPFMGTFIYALNAEDGTVEWMNDNTSALFIDQPHHYPAFAGIAPQGHLAVNKDRLYLPGGRSIPASLDRHTGKLQYFHLADYGKSGGSSVFVNEHSFWGHERDGDFSWFTLNTGRRRDELRGQTPILGEEAFYFSGLTIEKRNYKKPAALVWEADADASADLIRSGSRYYAGGEDTITVLKETKPDQEPVEEQTLTLDGTVARLITASERLIVTTEEGELFVFSAQESKTANEVKIAAGDSSASKEARAKAKQILETADSPAGYGIFVGIGDGELLKGVVAESKMKWLVLDNDSEKITKWRQNFDAVNLNAEPGSYPISFLEGDLDENYTLPVYYSNLTIVNDSAAIGFGDKEQQDSISESNLVQSLYEGLRPYGGTLWFNKPVESQELQNHLKKAQLKDKLEKADIQAMASSLVIKREGQLVGAGNWTHQYGNISNTVKSDDKRVKLPMGILWFGGSSNMDVLPRHGHGPPEQIIGGRLYIEGMDVLSARDVYTGRVLWKKKLIDVGSEGLFYDQTYKDTPLSIQYNQVHIPGANGRGTNFIATEDRVYVLQKNQCRVLDAVTGKDLGYFDLPKLKQGKKSEKVEEWGYVGVSQNNLIGGLGFARFSTRLKIPIDTSDKRRSKFRFIDYDKSASRGLVVMDRHSGKTKWQMSAKHSFIHNAVCVGKNVLYSLDKLPPNVEQQLARRGKVRPETYSLTARNIETGDIIWETSENIFGTWLGYSAEHRILIQSTRPSNDTVRDENGRQIIAYDAETGDVLWNEKISYSTPPILHGDKLITGGRFFDLLTGKPLMRVDPITGKEDVWSYISTKGCNYPIACESMLTFRSSSAAFYDMTNDGGTGHFGGFKSGCTSNLVAAEGLLNAPDYTRTCSCSFQNQTSLAMVHMPDLEIWTHNDMAYEGDLVRAVGVNFGAPGDRRDGEGTLWLDYPEVGGPSPSVTVVVNGKSDYYRDHSSRYAGEELKWVASSGVEGAEKVELIVKPTAIDQLDLGYPARSASDDAAEFPTGDMRIKDSKFYPTSSYDHTAGIRFSSIQLPQGSKVKKAWIQFTATKNHAEKAEVSIWGEADSVGKRFSPASKNITSRKRTKNKVDWDIPAWVSPERTDKQRTPDLTKVVQEVLDSPSWKPGNALVFIIKGTGTRIAVAADGTKKGSKTDIPRLFIELEDEDYTKLAEQSKLKERLYSVRLLFAEPNSEVKVGDRLFDLLLQGETKLKQFDIRAESKGTQKVLVKEFANVPVSSRLEIDFKSSTELKPILSGVELKLESE